MAQVAFTVRMDSDTKKKLDDLCKDFGMSTNTAFNIFARTVVKSRKIPFELESEEEVALRRAKEVVENIRNQAVKNGTANLSLEEINKEVKRYRAGK